MSCAKCKRDPQLPVTLDCNDNYCYMCLKEMISLSMINCVGCQMPLNIDINNISKDFQQVLSDLVGKHVWLYRSVSGDGYWMFDPKITSSIDTSYKSGVPGCNYLLGSKIYRIRFGNEEGEQLYSTSPNDPSPKRRYVKRVQFDKDEIKRLNIKGISGIFFQKIEDEIGKFI